MIYNDIMFLYIEYRIFCLSSYQSTIYSSYLSTLMQPKHMQSYMNTSNLKELAS